MDYKVYLNVALIFFFVNNAFGQWVIVDHDNSCVYRSIYFTNDSTGFVVGHCDDVDVILKSTDYGESWQEVYTEDASYFWDIYFPSDSVGYMGANQNVLKSIDGGESWFYPDPEAVGYTFKSIAFLNDEIGFGCFADAGAAFGVTEDGGYTWTLDYTYGGREILVAEDCEIRMISGNYRKSDNCWEDHETYFIEIGDRWPTNLAFVDNSAVLACGLGFDENSFQNFGFIIRSINDGQDWTIQDFEDIYALRSIELVNSSIAYCVGQAHYPNQLSFLKTVDAGETWYAQEYELPCFDCYSPNIQDIHCPSENTCYAISGNGAIYRTQNGGGELIPMGLVENTTANGLMVYPNPVISELRVRYGSMIEQVQVFNSLGQVVYEVHPNNASECSLQLSFLRSGLYHVVVQSKFDRMASPFVKF